MYELELVSRYCYHVQEAAERTHANRVIIQFQSSLLFSYNGSVRNGKRITIMLQIVLFNECEFYTQLMTTPLVCVRH